MIDSSMFSLQSSLGANYLNIPLDGRMELDEIAVRVLGEDCPDFLIPFKLMDHNDSSILKYRLKNAVALEYSNLTVPKADFMKLYLSLLIPFLKGKDWFLDYHHLCIDKSYVYLNKDFTNAYFLYIPEQSYYNTDEEILRFFQGVLNNVRITDDNSFMVQLYQYFSGGDVTLVDLYQLVEEESKRIKGVVSEGRLKPQKYLENPVPPEVKHVGIDGQNVMVQSVQKQGVVPKGVLEEKEKRKGFLKGGKRTEKPIKSPDISSEKPFFETDDYDNDEVIEALFGGDKKKKKEKKEKSIRKEKDIANEKSGKFLGRRKKVSEDVGTNDVRVIQRQQNILTPASQSITPSPQNYIQNNILPGYITQDTGETEIFDDNVQTADGYLELIDTSVVGAPAKIDLGFDKPYITIGRIGANSVKPDIVFSNEIKRIGRMHARIEKKEGTVYIIDLGSANRTSLNGEILIPNHPYPMKNGDELAFVPVRPVRYRVYL